MWDIDGNCYVDLVCGLLPNVLGHGDPDVDRAVDEQRARGVTFGLPTVLEYELASRLNRLIPSAEMVRFGNSGSDATTAAVRLARAYTGREHVIMCGYHGWHDWSIGHAETEANRAGVPRQTRERTWSIQHNHLGEPSRWPDWPSNRLAAVVIDCSKVLVADVEIAMTAARNTGAILIFDEVITGFRWHVGGAQSAWGITPDLACFSKAMANGWPISALCGKADIMQKLDHVFWSGTFFGFPPSLAAACATIDKIEREDVPRKLAARGNALLASTPASPHVRLSGHPSCQQLAFSSDVVRETFLTAMLANGVLLNTAVNLCYAHNDDDMDTVRHAWGCALDEVERVTEKAA